ncbi:MAG: polymerase sigma-70 factor [Paenibacillus sp.]|jgi:RNA polymerase sigma-70 factor (ECF subfamily)|nr:polymerase sigma-70 factor [Paenibacillus sp.]
MDEVNQVETGASEKFEYLQYISETTDRKAILRDLMTTHGDDVWNYAFSICRKPELADDITQDVFLKVYRRLTSFRGESSVKTWLLTITRNTALDYKRSAFWRKVTLFDRITTTGSSQSAEHEALEHLAINNIWSQVLQLPPKYREVLILFAHHQLSMKEIAEVLDISVGTVKSRLHHARLNILKTEERRSDEQG